MKQAKIDPWIEGTVVTVLMVSAAMLDQWKYGMGTMVAGVTGISWAIARKIGVQKQEAAFIRAFNRGYSEGFKNACGEYGGSDA